MTQIYEDGTYLDNNPGWHEEDSPWKAKQIDNIIKKNSLNPKTICEVGCPRDFLTMSYNRKINKL